MKTILLLDGKWLMYKALNTQYHLTHNEIKTGCVYSIISTTKSLLKKFKNAEPILLWDDDFSFRKQIYPEYKNKRNNIKDKILLEQIIAIREEYHNVMKQMKTIGIASYKRYGLEADDLFYFYVNQFPNKCIIVSKDEDLYQLLDTNRVVIYDPKEKKIKDQLWFENKYKLHPKQWAMVKAIGGCKSDNVKLLPGIGEETALSFLKATLNKKKYVHIITNWDKVEFALKLVKLPYEKFELLYKRTCLDIDAFTDLCMTYGFKSFLNDLNQFTELFHHK